MSARQVTISFPAEPTWFEKLLGKDKGQEVVAAGNKAAVALPNTDEVLYRFDSAVTSTDIFTKATRRFDTAATDSQPTEPTARPLPKPSGLFDDDDDDDDEPQLRRDRRAPADDDGGGFLATAMTDEQKRQQRDYSSLLLFDKGDPQPAARPAVRKQRSLFDDDSDDDDIFSAKRPAAEQASSEADALFHQAERLEERLQRAQQQQQPRRVVTSVGSASALAAPLTDASLDDDLFADTAPIAGASKPAGVDVAAQLNSMDDITAYLQAQTLANR